MQPTSVKLFRLARTVIASLCLFVLQKSSVAQTADSFNPAPNSQPNCMAIQPDKKILVGGAFTTIAGTSRPYLARLNPSGTLDTNFTAPVNSAVTCIVLQPDGKVLLGGYFTQVNKLPMTRLARLNVDGTIDTNFYATADNLPTALALQPDGKILVGGRFTQINGTGRTGLARLNTDGSLDSTFLPILSGYVNTLLVQPNGKIVVGGSFNIAGFYQNLVRFTSTGSAEALPITTANVAALALQADGKLLVGTDALTSGLIRIGTNSSVDMTFQATNIGSVNCIQPLTDGSMLVGTSGNALHVGATGVMDTNFTSFANSSVFALAVQGDGKILAAGAFTSIARTTRSHFARLINPSVSAETLTFDGNLNLQWSRYGAALETQSVNFFMTTDGTNWTDLGAAVRFGSAGWLLPTPAARNAIQIRARAYVSGGTYNGSSSQLEQITTTGAISILSQPTSRTANLGGTAQFAVSEGGLPATFQWFKDGAVLTNNSRILGTQSTTLTLANCTGADNGNYFVVLSNSVGTVTSSNAALVINDPLITSTTNQVATRSAGSTVTYVIGAIGTALKYQWLKNSSPIFGATNTSLVLFGLTGPDGGTYSAVVSSPYASVTNVVVTLHVIDPYLVAEPSVSAWNLGRVGKMYVTFAGALPMSYQWMKDGVTIPGATTSVLVITNVQFADTGLYNVVASNAYGSVTSSVRTPTVNTKRVDNFNPGVGYELTVYGLALDPANNIYVSGSVNIDGAYGTNMFWRLDPGGHPFANFHPNVTELSSVCCEPAGTILAGGGYTGFVRRLDETGTPNGTLDAEAAGSGKYVWGLCEQSDGAIIASGWFTNLANEPQAYVARINPDNSLDQFFAPDVDGAVNTAALQPDGKVLLGGQFKHLNGKPTSFLGRLNSDGSTDYSFDSSAYMPGLSAGVYCMAVQPDGKIIVGGLFTNLSGHTCTNLGRINSDGSFDGTFYGNAPDMVSSLVLQADGKIWVGGGYYIAMGSAVNGMALLNQDGTVDSSLNPNPNARVHGITLQSDGSVVIGGDFTNVAGVTRIGLARLVNPTPATDSFSFDGSTLTWWRGGGAPEVSRTSFEVCNDGVSWTPLGDGTRMTDSWQISGVQIAQSSVVRARGYFNAGFHNGSQSIVESQLSISGDRTPPTFAENGGLGLNESGFGFTIVGQPGQLVAVDRSTDLIGWQPLATNLLSSSSWVFTDPITSSDTNRFYRLRLP